MTLQQASRSVAAAVTVCCATLVLRAGSAPRPAVVEGPRLTIEISGGGVHVEPPAADPVRWSFGFSLRRWGLPGDRREAGPAWPLVSGHRIDLARGDLDEGFDNGPEGLEYTLRLTDRAGRGLAVLEYASDGSLTPKVREDGREIGFVASTGTPVLSLRDLRAVDADGRDVDLAWATSASAGAPAGGLTLLVQGFEHTYPILVTMLLVPQKTQGSLAEAASLSPAQPLTVPPNDLCGGAELIPAAGPFPYATGAYDVTDATTTGDPPVPSCQADVSRSIWFKFTPAATGNFTFATCSDGPTATTLPDTVLAIYASTGSCTGLTEVSGGCDDDSCVSGAQQSVISALGLTGGATYYVVAWQFGTTPPSAGSSTVQLLVSQNTSGGAPPNDQCSGAEVIPAGGPFPYQTAVTADITGAGVTGDPAAPSCQPDVSRSVWFRFTPAAPGNYTFASCADAPTGTTVDDTVIAVYSSTGACSGLGEIDGACDDDSCGAEAAQAVVSGVPLLAGQTYYVLAWKFDTAAPTIGNTAVQLRVDKGSGPANDFCSGAVPLALDSPVTGTTVNASDDYELSGSACFTGLGQTPTVAAGGEAAYKFTAPAAGSYSFRVNGYDPTKNVTLYVASDCPGGSSPATVAGCLAAANRNSGNPAEEVSCLALSSGQLVYVYVDEDAAGGAGSTFNVEVNACAAESEPNGTPAAAGSLVCGLEGAIGANGDADFFTLGVPSSGSRVFAIADGVAGSSTDFDVRVTTSTDTLEYDDANNDTAFGALSPNVAGTPLGVAAPYLRVNLRSAINTSEPYRLYATVQPASSTATPEIEPNGTTAAATSGANLYFSGSLSGTGDVDIFRFTATAGELLSLDLDLDPTRDNTPFNGILTLLDPAGVTLQAVNDSGGTSSITSGAGSLTATNPNAPAESLTYRIRASGTYYAKVQYSSGTAGDYLLSVARNCKISPSSDLSVTQADAPDPVALAGNVTYTIVVHNLGAAPASVVELRDDIPVGSAFVSATPSQGSCAGTGPVSCHFGNIAAGGTASVALVVTAPGSSGPMVNAARVQTMVIDTNAANDASSETTTVGSADADLDGVSDAQDCAPNDGTSWAIPGEALGFVFPVPSNKTSMQWSAPGVPGGTVVYYDLVRSAIAGNFATPTCLVTHASATTGSDAQVPAGAFFYLVRSENACGGNLGTRSNGTPRTAGSCP